MSDCYFSDIQAISKFVFFFMLRLDAIRITRVLWFIQFVLDLFIYLSDPVVLGSSPSSSSHDIVSVGVL